MPFTKTIVRPPWVNFAKGLTSAGLGRPNLKLALQQHAAYCATLESCGVRVIPLEPDALHPDSTFVEDTAIVTERGAILSRPGAESRRGEVDVMRPALEKYFAHGTAQAPPLQASRDAWAQQAAPLRLPEIHAPGTLDGGDVCDAGGHFFIGISARTNEAGAQQLADWLQGLGYTATTVDIRGAGGLLHLKSGLAWLGEKRLVVVDALAERAEFRDHELMRVAADEEYAANCVCVNDTVLIAQGFPKFETALRSLGLKTLALEMSEFRKMDGGLSCLSLRW